MSDNGISMRAQAAPTTLLVGRSDEGALVTITLNRPAKLNAMTTEMMTELYDVLCEIEADPVARVVVLRGSGKGFCAGADLLANALGIGGTKWDSTRINNQERFSRVVIKMARMPQVVISALHGAVSGGGFALALASDMRVAGKSAKMNAAFIAIGLSGCEMGTSFHLPRICGSANAAKILMTGDFVSADEALRLGIVSDVVADEDVYDTAVGLARRCLKASWLGLRLTKQLLRGAADGSSLEHAVHSEDLSQVLCLNDKDTQEFTAAKTARFLPKSQL